MAKLKNPLASLRASGRLGKALSFAYRRGRHLVEKKPVPTDARSEAQVSWRTMFNLCVDLWHELSAAEKAVWESAGTARHMTGYAWYLSQCLRPNPGIYLPLAGGTMTGNILMGANQIRGLPNPTLAAEATRKSYVDALDRGEGHKTLFGWNYNTIGQGNWVIGPTPNAIFGNFNNGITLADGDNFTLKDYLAQGTYSLRYICRENNNIGIVDIDIDGVEVASFDAYAPALGYDIVFFQGNIVIAAPGLKTITVRVDGKNASSVTFGCWYNEIALWRTA